ncbi:sporulation histidine kinase inhibitor Sda [Bacillus taeanensis]|uniref:Sporulation histidine kinase inhibitor Sda n=1 Tax=Bacillus taeanensis TaxID=273032 RepID=A0A366Y383_9BACI|nr:sporulation histidine kinase inhibitor Sda [Bacillus taeanensis]
MHKLSNQVLIHSYSKAIELQLDTAFISLLQEELNRRKFTLSQYLNPS